MTAGQKVPSILIVGASRGLGFALAGEFVKRGWHVVGTVRSTNQTPFGKLAQDHPSQVVQEQLDINEPEQLGALNKRLRQNKSIFDILFVNAGMLTHKSDPIGEVPKEAFINMMVTNAYSPLRVIESLGDLVKPGGLIGAMSSGVASISRTAESTMEAYRASKTALNMLMKSVSVRKDNRERAYLVLSPGWVSTEMGGDRAPATAEDTAPKLADTILSTKGKPGLHYLGPDGKNIPW